MTSAGMVLLLFSLLTLGCARAVQGQLATPLSGSGEQATALQVRSRSLPGLSSPGLHAVEVTFENRSTQFQRVHDVQVAPGAPATIVDIPVGSQLFAWHGAALQKAAVAKANRETTLELLLLGAGVAMEVGESADSRATAFAGAVVGLGSATALTAHPMNARGNRAERAPIVPDRHLLSGDFWVPPGLFTKRWVLLHTPARSQPNCMSLVVGFRVSDGPPQQVALRLGRWYRHQLQMRARACH